MNTAPYMSNLNMSGDEWLENNPWIVRRDTSQPGCGAYRCMLCSCPLSSSKDVQKHLVGSRHDKNLRKQEKMSAASKSKTLRNEAQICDPRPLSNNSEMMAFLNSEIAAQHADGRRLPGLEYIFSSGKGKDMSFDCALCQMRMNSKTVLISHLLGMKHSIAYLESIDEESLNQIKEQYKDKTIFAQTVRQFIDWHLRSQTNHVNKQDAKCQSAPANPKPPAVHSSSNTSNHLKETREAKTTKAPMQNANSSCAVSNEAKETICDFITYCDLVTWAQRSKIKTKAEEASALKLISIFLEQIFYYRTRTVPEQFQKLLYRAVLENDYPQMNSILNHLVAAKK